MSNNRDIPIGWTIIALSEVIEQSAERQAPDPNSEEKFLGMDCIPPNSMIPSHFQRFREMKSSGIRFEQANVLYGRMRPYLNKVYKANISGVCSGEFIVLRPSIAIDSSFLAYLLHSREFTKFASKKTKGDRPRITFSEVGTYILPLPPLAEQARIVAKIEELFSSLDKGVESLKAAKEQLKVYRQAVLTWAFSKNNMSNPKSIPSLKLEELCFFITKGTTPKNLTAGEGEIPYIKVYNLTLSGRLDFTVNPTFVPQVTHAKDLYRSITVPGDVLMNIVGPPLGKVSIVPDNYEAWNINQAVARFRCKSNLNNRYLAYHLLSHETVQRVTKKAKATSGQVNLTLEICRNIEIPLPPITQQQSIVSFIESRFSACDKLEEAIDQGLAQAEALRQSILKKAFEGRLVPQDPNDEPASILLERIRTERAAEEHKRPARKSAAGPGDSSDRQGTSRRQGRPRKVEPTSSEPARRGPGRPRKNKES